MVWNIQGEWFLKVLHFPLDIALTLIHSHYPMYRIWVIFVDLFQLCTLFFVCFSNLQAWTYQEGFNLFQRRNWSVLSPLFFFVFCFCLFVWEEAIFCKNWKVFHVRIFQCPKRNLSMNWLRTKPTSSVTAIATRDVLPMHVCTTWMTEGEEFIMALNCSWGISHALRKVSCFHMVCFPFGLFGQKLC